MVSRNDLVLLMNTSFRTAFWAMCLGLIVPMVLYVGAELSGGRSQRRPDKALADHHGSLREYLQKVGPKTADRKSTGHQSPRQTASGTANRRAEPPRVEKPAPEDPKLPAVVLGPLLETDLTATEPARDRRIPARSLAGRPRVEILPEPETVAGPGQPAGPDLETRLAGIQRNLDRLESVLAVQAQRPPPVDVVQQTAEILKLLREAREFENASSQSSSVAAPEERADPAKIASNPSDVLPEKEKSSREYDAELDHAEQPTPVPPQPETKIYHPRYLSGSALQTLVAPLLTREIGKVGATDAGTDESALAAGGDSSPAPVSVLVVRDLPEVLRKIDRLVQEVDVPPLPVKIEATVITLHLDEGRPHGIDLLEFNAANRTFVLSPAECSADGSAAPSQTAEAPQLTHGFGLKCGVLQGDPRAFINVLQSAAQVRRANAWQISVLNRQSAQLVLNDVGAANTSPGQAASGTTLRVRPIVTPDGVVHLDVRRDNEFDGRAAGNRSGALTHQIALREGQTAVVGGFFAEQLASYTYGTPGFSKLPVFGKHFRKQVGMLDRSETIVVLTPHVARPAPEVPGVAHRGERSQKLPRGRPILKETAANSRLFGRKLAASPAPAPGSTATQAPQSSEPDRAPARQPNSQQRRPAPQGVAALAAPDETAPPTILVDAGATAAQCPPRRMPFAPKDAKPISPNTDAEIVSKAAHPRRPAAAAACLVAPVAVIVPIRPFRVDESPVAKEDSEANETGPDDVDGIPDPQRPTLPETGPVQ